MMMMMMMMMMVVDFLRRKKKMKKIFVTCLGLQTYKQMNKTLLLELAIKLNITHRKCVKTKEELEEATKDTITKYKKIVFGSDTPTFIACLDELRIQQTIDQKVYDQKLMEDTMRKFEWDGH